MESQLIRLNNKLIRKRIDYIEIQGTCDKNGRIKQQFIDIMNMIIMFLLQVHNLARYFQTLLKIKMINFII